MATNLQSALIMVLTYLSDFCEYNFRFSERFSSRLAERDTDKPRLIGLYSLMQISSAPVTIAET